ncbi:Glutaredoxin, partial [Musa troglodytarum]
MSPPRRGRDGGRILRPPVLDLSPSPEPTSPELIPKDAVLYQYEACPLCNKVEGNSRFLLWVDDHLVHVLSPNIYRTTSEVLESFDYMSKHGNFSTTERFTAKYTGAAIMFMVSKKLKKHMTSPALREAAQTWTQLSLAEAGKDMENTKISDRYQRMEMDVEESARKALRREEKN